MENKDDVTYGICSNPQCRIAETGRCVEGLELSSCPNYEAEALDALVGDTSVGDDNAHYEVDQNVVLPSAETLNLEGASAVLRQGKARVVAVLGPSDSGKTSLIASLYDLFQQGPVDGIEFARSRTLHAFEETCHNARAASRRGEPEQNRTPYGDVHFYHIEIGGLSEEGHISLLLGDRAGEEYMAAADNLSVVAGFAEVPRADVLTVLVDGERLVDTKSRHNLRSDIRMVLQAMHDGEALITGIRLALVLTKLDAVSSSEHRERALNDFRVLTEEIQRLFGDTLAEVEPFHVAASPKSPILQRGTGVSSLLKFWLSPTAAAPIPTPIRLDSSRVFSRLVTPDDSLEDPLD
jgi:energy-coupling factor transporter ATP-binding protein EcfA2